MKKWIISQSYNYNYIFFGGQMSVDCDFLLILIFPDLLLCLCVCSYVHFAALEVAALALVRSTESARRSHGRLSGANS